MAANCVHFAPINVREAASDGCQECLKLGDT